MASAIDVTKPVSGSPTTQSVRDNFTAAKSEIEALQTDKANLAAPALTGNATAVNLTVSGTLNAGGTLELGGVAITSTAAELNFVDGVTSNIQTQLDGKAATAHTHAAADVTSGTFADARISQSSVTQHQAAINAGQVDGKSISVVASLPGSPDANTLYFVTS